MTINHWDQLTDRQKLIRVSMVTYYFATLGLPYHRYVTLEGFQG